MGTLNSDFKYPKFFKLFIALIFAAFLIMFMLTITAVVGAFDAQLDSPTIASISLVGN